MHIAERGIKTNKSQLISFNWCFSSLRNVFYNCVMVDLTKPRLLQFPATMGSHGEVVEDEHCSVLPKPASVEECQGSCDATRWEYSDWSDVRTLNIKCMCISFVFCVCV